ncbi:MAG: TetR/AcrR family transcriptional regulator [Bacteroidales bacterium]|nr:TetR/AcrR family transcriptional regulator [Bacteroidales bacterium]
MNKTNTEENIIQAAEYEFIERGFEGARMQAIADKAGINKALLHYYFRSKQKLFEVIFKNAFKLFIPRILNVFEREDINFFEKIEAFVENYLNILAKHPHIPGFIIHELANNPSSIVKIVQEIAPDLSPIKQQIEAEVSKGTIRNIRSEHLILNVLSMSIFPIVASPIATMILFNGDKKQYATLLSERKNHVSDFIIQSIKNPNL